MTITLPLPETTNSTYRTGKNGWYKSKKAQQWEREAFFILKANKVKLFERDVAVTILMHLKRERDIDSCLKPLLDVLQKAGVYTDDKQVTNLFVQKVIDSQPCMQVKVEGI